MRMLCRIKITGVSVCKAILLFLKNLKFVVHIELTLQYRGRFAANKGGTSSVENAKRELLLAMQQIAQTGRGPREQTPSMGCSIKWK